MLVCENAIIEKWKPDFSDSDQEDPIWYRVILEKKELSNCIEYVGHETNPNQLILCNVCGYHHCTPGNYAHVSHLESDVLLTAPQDETDPYKDIETWEDEVEECIYFIRKYGSVLIPSYEWNRWRSLAPNLFDQSKLEHTNVRSLADAWRMRPLGETRVQCLEQVVPMLKERLLAVDSLEVSQTISYIEQFIDWFERNLENDLAGSIQTAECQKAKVERLYFDGPKEGDWPALALTSDSVLIALNHEYVFVPKWNSDKFKR